MNEPRLTPAVEANSTDRRLDEQMDQHAAAIAESVPAAPPIADTEPSEPEPSAAAAPEPENEVVAAAGPVEAQPVASRSVAVSEEPPPEPPFQPAPPTAAAPAAPDAVMASEAAIVEQGIGVLLVNLGTPEAAEPAAVRRYLKEFLTDRRVIERDSLLWRLLLNGFILPLRSRRKANDYKKIWNNEKNESPLKTITRSQAEKLAVALEPLGGHVVVDWAMRYGSPSIRSRLDVLVKRGCERLLVMPLYPQYAAPTTATVCDEVFRFLMGLRRQPALRILPAYYEDAPYVEALASSLKAEIAALPFEPDVILASYHGMPKSYVANGDPYESQCTRTTQLLREQLGYDETRLMMTFQSRFGRAKWLGPATIDTVKALAKKGVKNLVVVMPGFAADCLETLEEIAIDNARVFRRYRGQNFAALACLNDSEAGMGMLGEIATRELQGWV